MDLTAFTEVEHYIAKTVRPERAFDWDNLLPVCSICNVSKGSTDHVGDLLMPTEEDGEPMLWLNPDSGKLELPVRIDGIAARRVERSIELCNLQRPVLCDQRIGMMERVKHWLERVQERGGDLDAKLRREWDHFTNPRTEYKFVIRHVLRHQPRLAAYDRQRFEAGG